MSRIIDPLIELGNENYNAIVDLREVAAMDCNHTGVPTVTVTFRRGESRQFPLHSRYELEDALAAYRRYIKETTDE